MMRGRKYRSLRTICITGFILFLLYNLITTLFGLLSSLNGRHTTDDTTDDFNLPSVHLRRQLSTDTSPFDVSRNKRDAPQNSHEPRQVLKPYELMTYVWNVPKIKFLDEFRSPCFYEQRQGLALRKNTVERALTMEGGKYLRCMPHFMLAG